MEKSKLVVRNKGQNLAVMSQKKIEFSRLKEFPTAAWNRRGKGSEKNAVWNEGGIS